MIKGKKPFRNRKNQKPQVKEYDEKVLQISRITRVVKGGRRLRFRAAVVIGNKKGKVGFAVSKAGEVQKAVQKAAAKAKKQLIKVPISEKNSTIPHEIEKRFASSKVLIKPASKGTSLIAGNTVKSVMELAGYKNILSKTIGSTSKINSAYATIECLKALHTQENDQAK